MKKLLIIVFIIIIIGIACFIIVNPRDSITEEEQEFNDSGRAKAILDETDLWMIYEGDGFTIKYPHNVSLNSMDKDYGLYIEEININSLEPEAPLGFGKTNVLKNKDSLTQGLYGEESGFEIGGLLRIIGDVYARDYLTLSMFEICDVRFERSLYFFRNDNLVIITLKAPKDNIIEQYFTTNQENCGDQLIWGNQQLYAIDLRSGEIIQEWYDLFDDIVNTIEFYEQGYSIQGRWQSLDDENSIIEFNGNNKIDYYKDELIEQNEYVIEGDRLTSGDMTYTIVELTEDTLILTYLARGNTLNYGKIK